MTRLFSTGQYPQYGNSDLSGGFYTTFNCEFEENIGAIRVGKRAVLNVSTSDVAELTGAPVGFRYFFNGTATNIYTAAGASNTGYVFTSGSPDATFSKVVTSGAPTTLDSTTTDLETAFGNIYFSSAADGKIYFLNGSNVWNSLTAGSAGNTVMLCFMPSRQRMYCTKNGNQIQSWDSSNVPASPTSPFTLTLPVGTVITWIRPGSDRIWIGTVDQYGGKGYVYEWDGSASTYTKAYKLRSAGALACEIKDDVPHITDAKGSYLVWNGGTFVRKTGFNRKMQKQLYNATFTLNSRFIHPNGMSIIGDSVGVLVDLTNNDAASHAGTQEDCNPSGVYMFDESTNSLRHRFGTTLNKSVGTIKDYGQVRIAKAGGLAELIITSTLSNGTVLIGASFYADASSTALSGIFYEDTADTLQKAASFVIAWLRAPGEDLTEAWAYVYMLHKKFLTGTDRIVIKGRTSDDIPTEATITWTTPSAFNTTSDLSAYVLGDEVDVIQGLGSGKPAHITAIQRADTGWIVTVDETYVGATGTSKARISKWRKFSTIQDIKDFAKAKVTLTSRKLEIKVWMLSTGKNEIDGIIIPNKNEEQTI